MGVRVIVLNRSCILACYYVSIGLSGAINATVVFVVKQRHRWRFPIDRVSNKYGMNTILIVRTLYCIRVELCALNFSEFETILVKRNDV